jgi:hypothetical protein
MRRSSVVKVVMAVLVGLALVTFAVFVIDKFGSVMGSGLPKC